MRKIIIGSRSSKLALVQSEWVMAELQKAYPQYQFELIKVKTLGDKILDVPLAKIGDKGLFTKELENALLANEIDIAVHSLKDVPTKLPEGLWISAISEREDCRDAFVSNKYNNLKELPQGAVVGTSSLRRIAQIKAFRPDLTIKDLRGNLQTRLGRLEEGEFDAIILASAGLKRLGLADCIKSAINFETSLTAVGQGALGVETRLKDLEVNAMVHQVIHHEKTAIETQAERAFLRELEGGCQVPIGALGLLNGDKLTLTGLVASLDGKTIYKDSITMGKGDSEELGTNLAKKLRAAGAGAILEKIFAEHRTK
jgi:hydroxymethylbilane synthase